jgi:hypothetical protein
MKRARQALKSIKNNKNNTEEKLQLILKETPRKEILMEDTCL